MSSETRSAVLAAAAGAGGLLTPPLVPRAGEEVRASRGELEHCGRHGLEEPAIVRDEDHGRVDRVELALEPLEVLDVQVVRRLVEEEQVGVAGEHARERGARELPTRERVETPVEISVGEAETAHGGGDTVAPTPTTAVLEPCSAHRSSDEAWPRRERRQPSPPRAGVARSRPRADRGRRRARTRGG